MDGVVKWVASQSTNPALQALIKEAERDKKSELTLSPPLHSFQPSALSSSTSSINRLRESARPRSSSHSTARSVPYQDEPEAATFIELLRDVSRQLDENSKKKQKLAVREKGKAREHSLGQDAHTWGARSLTKTSSASSIWPAAPDRTCSRVVTKTESLGAQGVDLLSGKSKPSSLPIPNLNYDLKLARSLPRPSDVSPMQDVIDLTDTDTELEGPVSRSITYMQVDDQDSDVAMDTSFFIEDLPPRIRVAPPRPRVACPPPPSMQRSRTGPPPLGMRRAVQPQHSQYSSSQTSKTLTVPRFKPPLLTSKKPPATTAGSRQPRDKSTQVGLTETALEARDADSSFDVSFGVDPDELEETMKLYD